MHKDMKTIMQEVLQPWVLKSSINQIDAPITDLLRKEFEEFPSYHEDWRTTLKAKFKSPEGTTDLKELKYYVLIFWDPYGRPLRES